MRYQIQWIKFYGRPTPIVLQYVNGPCPLLAVCNVLFLRGQLTLPVGTQEVEFEQLCNLLRGFMQRQMQELVLKGGDEARIANGLQNLEDMGGVLPKLEAGLDINVRFTHPLEYEFTTELALFDLCGCRLVHGWVFDAQDANLKRVVDNLSYNELVTYLTTDEAPGACAEDSDEVKSSKLVAHLADKSTAQNFLNESQSQLTIAGLAALHEVLADEELAVLFRNNHFSVCLKHNSRLYTLVSDSGMISAAPYIVWSYVSDVCGDQLFLDHEWKIPHPDTVAYYARANQRPPIVQHQTPSPQPPLQSPQPSPQHPYPAAAAMSMPPANRQQMLAPPTSSALAPSAPPGGPPAAPLSSPPAGVSASANSMSVLQQQQLFARQNGMVWNEATQNYEPLPRQQQPPAQPHTQMRQQAIDARMRRLELQEAHQKKKEKDRKDSCAIQ